MSRAPHQKDGIGGKLRNVLLRAAQSLGYPNQRSVNAADLHWDDEDYQPTITERERVFDPWTSEDTEPHVEKQPSSAGARTSAEEKREGIPVGVHLQVAKASEGVGAPPETAQHVDPAVEEDVEEQAGGGRFVETDENWKLLEDAESDLIEAEAEVEDAAEDSLITEARDADAWRTASGPDAKVTLHPALKVDNSDVYDTESVFDDDWSVEQDEFDGLSVLGFDESADSLENDDVDAFDFDEDAHQTPWTLEEEREDEVADLRASAKAATIVGLLDLRSIRERQDALEYLRALFEHLTAPATFHAIRGCAEEGLELATLIAMVELRALWAQRSEWWLMRSHGRIVYMRHGQSALSWPLARRVCLARSDHAIEDMIDEEWLEEWLTLGPGCPGYLYFTQFIDEKVSHADAENLHYALHLQEKCETAQELGNDYSWYRQVPDRDGSIRMGFHFLTPYDERPGVIRPGVRNTRNDED